MAIILVTGASRGLGLETVRQLAAAGHDVIAASRDATAGAAAIRGLRTGGRGSIHVLALDVANDESVRAAVASNPGRLDAIVNNAGVSLDGFDATVAARTLDTNYRGAVRVTDAFAPLLSPGGRIVMVSSGMGEVSCLGPELRRKFLDPGLSREGLDALVASFIEDVRNGVHAKRGWPSNAYRVSKVAMNAFTRIVARDGTMTINAVCPGWVRTDLGGRSASRSVEEGARGIVWAATEATSSGGFYRDGKPIDW